MLVHVHESANPAGHLKYLNAQNNKLAIFQKLKAIQNFAATRFSLTVFGVSQPAADPCSPCLAY